MFFFVTSNPASCRDFVLAISVLYHVYLVFSRCYNGERSIVYLNYIFVQYFVKVVVCFKMSVPEIFLCCKLQMSLAELNISSRKYKVSAKNRS